MGYSTETFAKCVDQAFHEYMLEFNIVKHTVSGYGVTMEFLSDKKKTSWPSYMTFNGEDTKCTVTSPFGSPKPNIVAQRIIDLLKESN